METPPGLSVWDSKIRTIFCADLPFLHLLLSRCCPQNAVHILLYDAILLHLAFGIIVLPLHLVFLLGQLLILVFQGVEVGQLLKALLFQGLGRRFIENQGALVLVPELLFVSSLLILPQQWAQFLTGCDILYQHGHF